MFVLFFTDVSVPTELCDRFAAAIDGLRRVPAFSAARERVPGLLPLLMLLDPRLRRLKQRFAALVAKIRAGRHLSTRRRAARALSRRNPPRTNPRRPNPRRPNPQRPRRRRPRPRACRAGPPGCCG